MVPVSLAFTVKFLGIFEGKQEKFKKFWGLGWGMVVEYSGESENLWLKSGVGLVGLSFGFW